MSKSKHAPGILCYLKNCHFPENEGLVVQLVERVPRLDPVMGGPVWLVESREPGKVLITMGGFQGTVVSDRLSHAIQPNLIPINDPGLTTDDLTVKELENV